MVIVDNREDKEIRFCEIEHGDVFVYQGHLYMKTPSVVAINNDYFNAINLNTNKFTGFERGCALKVLNCKLVIE